MIATLILKEKEFLIDNIWSFRFTPSEPQTWIAGQYMSVELPHDTPDSKGTKRWFTISSAPSEGYMQITTRVSDSSFKQALANLPIGGQLNLLDTPHGEFTWQDTDKPKVFVAGGIGITSFRSMLKERSNNKLPLAAHLIYGNRTDSVAFKEELDAYAANEADFKVTYVVGKPLTVSTLTELEPAIYDSLVYISGPQPVVTVGRELKTAGLPADQFKEDFYPTYTEKNY